MPFALELAPNERNLTIEELLNIDEPWAHRAVFVLLRDGEDFVTGEWEGYLEESFDEGAASVGTAEYFRSGEIKGYKQGFEDGSFDKVFNEDYRD